MGLEPAVDNSRSNAGLKGALWPATFDSEFHVVRIHAHALAALIIEFTVLAAYDSYYWSDSFWGRKSELNWLASSMAPPILLMCATLAVAASGWRNQGLRRTLASLAWLASIVGAPFSLLVVYLSSDDLCETTAPAVPLHLNLWLMVPLGIAIAMGTGSFVSWAVWASTRRRVHAALLYAVWLLVSAVSLFLLLAPVLSKSPTCSPLTGG